MAESIEFYEARAADCERQAEQASLPQVRDRLLQAAMAWRGMAQRVTDIEAARSHRRTDDWAYMASAVQ